MAPRPVSYTHLDRGRSDQQSRGTGQPESSRWSSSTRPSLSLIHIWVEFEAGELLGKRLKQAVELSGAKLKGRLDVGSNYSFCIKKINEFYFLYFQVIIIIISTYIKTGCSLSFGTSPLPGGCQYNKGELTYVHLSTSCGE